MRVQSTLIHQAAMLGVPPTFYAQDAAHTMPLAQTLEALDWTTMHCAAA